MNPITKSEKNFYQRYYYSDRVVVCYPYTVLYNYFHIRIKNNIRILSSIKFLFELWRCPIFDTLQGVPFEFVVLHQRQKVLISTLRNCWTAFWKSELELWLFYRSCQKHPLMNWCFFVDESNYITDMIQQTEVERFCCVAYSLFVCYKLCNI